MGLLYLLGPVLPFHHTSPHAYSGKITKIPNGPFLQFLGNKGTSLQILKKK